MAGLFSLCAICGGDDLHAGGDGFFYCTVCGSQSQQFQEQAIEDLEGQQLAGYHKASHERVTVSAAGKDGTSAELHMEDPPQNPKAPCFSDFGEPENPWETQLWSQKPLKKITVGFIDPFETLDDEGSSIRSLYVEGLQETLQLQCEALVSTFGVSPLICGIIGPVWLRFIASSHVYEKDWAREALQIEEAKSNMRREECPKYQNQEYKDTNDDGRLEMRMALRFIWLNALKVRIPVCITLALAYLACHIARQPILPTDIVNWALDGSLPYLTAFRHLENNRAGFTWPIKAKLMFKPKLVIGAKKLEHMAAAVARRTGLQLPPVNFHAIACRLLNQLNLPVQKLSGYVCRFFDWFTPSGLWLSDEKYALPSRVFVMAMIVIVVKVLYKVDGTWRCGKHDKPLNAYECHTAEAAAINECNEGYRVQDSSSANGSEEDTEDNEVTDHCKEEGNISPRNRCHNIFEAEQAQPDAWCFEHLLQMLVKPWHDSSDQLFDKERDLTPYLKYCQDVIFSGFDLEYEEDNLCERLWKFYEQPAVKERVIPEEKPSQAQSLNVSACSSFYGDGLLSLNGQVPVPEANANISTSPMVVSDEAKSSFFSTARKGRFPTHFDRSRWSLQEIKEAMEELGFRCVVPRQHPVPSGRYLRYIRKHHRGAKIAKHGMHADYFILLCSCAKAISVKPATLYWGVQRLEKSLLRIERKVKSMVEQTSNNTSVTSKLGELASHSDA